jgi:hypothetical protein
MNGFDFKPPGNPFQMLTPEMLAQAAGAAFRPPQPVMMAGLNLQPSLPPMQQQAPGFSLGDGMALASAALKALGNGKRDGSIVNAGPQGSGPGGSYTTADAMSMSGLNAIMNAGPQGSGPGGSYTTADAMGMAGLNDKQTLSPMDPGYGDLGGPGMKQDGGFLDFLTNLPTKLGIGTGASGGSTVGGASDGGVGAGAGAVAVPLMAAAGIGLGKNTEANYAGTPVGDLLLAGLGPSAAQIIKDPLGMGLPTLLGVPFITPFTASQDAKQTKPEWSSLFPFGV